MLVGILQVEVFVPSATSLKDKRRVVRSLKDRLHREHQVSVAEVGDPERHRVAMLGVSMVSNDAKVISATFDRVLRKVEATPDARLGDHQREILCGDGPSAPAAGGAESDWNEDERREDVAGRGAA